MSECHLVQSENGKNDGQATLCTLHDTRCNAEMANNVHR